MEFKGWDWSELAEHFGIPVAEDEVPEESEALAALRELLSRARFKDTDKVAGPCREFVKALAKESAKIDYYTPLWMGLLAVKDDSTFLSALSCLLPTAWT